MKMVMKTLCCSLVLLPLTLHAAGVAGGGGGAQGRSIASDMVKILPQFEIQGDQYRRFKARLSGSSAAPVVVRVQGGEVGSRDKAFKELQLQSMTINQETVLVGTEETNKVWRIEAEKQD
jgi:hypothetical protein